MTCNNLLFKLKESELTEKVRRAGFLLAAGLCCVRSRLTPVAMCCAQIDEVAALMKAAGVEPNETTKKILQ